MAIRGLMVMGVGLTLAACANMKTVQDAPADSGEKRAFDAPYETVREATLDSIRDMKLAPSSTEETPEGFVILIARAPHGMSWGEVGRVIVQKNDAPPTTVQVNYQRRFALQFVGSGDRFARALFVRIDKSLGTDAK
jgi:hypothetical protein